MGLGRVGTLLLLPLQPGSFWVLGAGFFPLVFQALGGGGERRILGLFISLDLGERPGRAWRRAIGTVGVGERTGQSVPSVGDMLTPVETPQLIL